jgi:hypothetical protein
MSNRRHFLRSVVLVGAALSVRPITSWAANVGSSASIGEAAPATGTIEPLSHAAFAGSLGNTFSLADGSALVLDKVSPLERGAYTESFSVWLRNDARVELAQGTHVFEHETMGRFEMFVVPKVAADGRAGCEAVFNRLVA